MRYSTKRHRFCLLGILQHASWHAQKPLAIFAETPPCTKLVPEKYGGFVDGRPTNLYESIELKLVSKQKHSISMLLPGWLVGWLAGWLVG